MKATKKQKLDMIRPNFDKTGMYDMSDIQRHAIGHFFDKDAMRFFRSRLLSTIYPSVNKVYFVTSEQFVSPSHTATRMFTVRCLDLNTRRIETIGEFNEKD